MSTANVPSAEHREHYRLEVSSYDRASSLLVALLAIATVTILALIIVFFARRLVSVPVPIPVLPLDPAERPTDAAMGVAQDIEPPGIEDAPELTEPQLMDTLNALTSKLSSKVAVLSDEMLDANNQASKGKGLGDSRTAGGGGGAPLPGREYQLEVTDIDEYAAWLDFFGIEIVAFTPGPNNPVVHLAGNFAAAKPAIRTLKYADLTKVLTAYPNGPHGPFVTKLAIKAGIRDKGQGLRLVFSDKTATLLAGLEQERARQAGKQIGDIEHTVFKVTSKGAAFEFSVEEQLYY